MLVIERLDTVFQELQVEGDSGVSQEIIAVLYSERGEHRM